MIGGDADLAGSTKTLIKGAENTGFAAAVAIPITHDRCVPTLTE